MSKLRLVSTIICAVLVCANVYMSASIFRLGGQLASVGPLFRAQAEAYVLPVTQADYLPTLDTSAGNLSIDAKAALVLDVSTGRNLYQKNIQQRLPIASLTKIMTAIIVWERLKPDDVVTVAPTAMKVDGERQDLYKGEQLTVRSLMELMLIRSSNDAAYALRDFAKQQGIDLIAEMNEKASELGMRSTHFTDPAGLDDAAYSTAEDLGKAVKYALQYDAIWNVSRQPSATIQSVDGRILHEVQSTDQLLGVLSDIIGGKTGYTDGALGCMILIVNASHGDNKIIGIVLGSTARFEAMKDMVQWTQRAYRWQ